MTAQPRPENPPPRTRTNWHEQMSGPANNPGEWWMVWEGDYRSANDNLGKLKSGKLRFHDRHGPWEFQLYKSEDGKGMIYARYNPD